KYPQNRRLAYAVIALLIVAGGALAFYSKYILLQPHLLRVHSPFVFLIPPLIYLYVMSSMNRKKPVLRDTWFHYLPFLITVIAFLPVYNLSAAQKLVYIRDQFIGLKDQQYIFYYSSIASFVVYFVAVIRHLIQSYYRYDRPADEVKQIVKWLFAYSAIILLIGLVAILRIFIGISNETTQWIPLIISLFIYLISYEAIRKPELFKAMQIEKYSSSKASSDELKSMIQTVSDLVKQEKMYLKEHVSIQALAKQAGFNVNDLSRALNEVLQQNYFDFINSFRLELATQLLSDPDYAHYSIEGIGSEAGFKSKASFYSAFKKQLAMTPMEFREKAVQLSKSEP
ncbi:MAG: AraC family transcriptional regulator, partial [Calditrichaeota bacterium]|nr:AraC family transcriptional regulator [Calditrichota bacterium]